MFRVFELMVWAAMLVLLLYIWADVREIAGIAKENKRELLRASLSVRTAESYPNFREEKRGGELEKEAQEEEEQKEKDTPEKRGLNSSEERVLEEVLTEFLG